VDAVEVATEVDVVLGPDLAQHLQELSGATVALVVFQPGFAEVGELVLEPAGDDVDGETPARELIRGGSELGQDARLPKPRVYGGDHLEAFGGQQQCQAEAGRFVLKLGAVAGFVADLAERVFEAVVLRGLRQLLVVVVVPVRALLDIAGHQAAADVGHPVGELDVVCDAFGRHV
jgi:hypothetical protein